MSNAAFGYENRVVTGSIAAGSEIAGLTAGNLQTPRASEANSWRTAGVTNSAGGAWLMIDAGASTTFRAFCLSRTNLSAAATVRWRVGAAESVAEEVPVLALDFDPNTWVAPAGWAFTRAGAVSTRVNSAGVIETIGANALRWHYDPATLALRGLLLEDARTNFATSSGDLSATAWNGASTANRTWATVAAITAPDGSSLTKKFTATAGGSLDTICTSYFSVVTSGSTVSASVFVKPAEVTTFRITPYGTGPGGGFGGQAAFTLTGTGTASAATGGAATIQAYPNGWYRCTNTWTLNASAVANMALGWDGPDYTAAGQGLYLWGGQVEIGSWPTSYIPTTASAATRSADQATITGLPASITSSTLTVAALATTFSASGTHFVAQLDNGTTTDTLAVDVEALQIRAFAKVANVTVGSIYGASVLVNQPFYTMGAFQPSSTSVAARTGAASTISTAFSLPPTPTRLWLGRTNSNAALNGCLRSFKLYATRLTTGQVAGYSLAGSTLSTAGLAYDSGTVSAGVVAGIGQSVTYAPAVATARYCRVDIDDPANPDGFVQVGAVYAGPVWQPGVNIATSSAIAPTRARTVVTTRGGSQFVQPLYYQRGWAIAHDALAYADLWAKLWPLDQSAHLGDNVLFLPDPASANLNAEAVLGLFEVQSSVTFQTPRGDFRAWRARIAERM